MTRPWVQQYQEVPSMRLGKEKASGYVEDTEADTVLTEEITAEQSEQAPLSPASEPALPVS